MSIHVTQETERLVHEEIRSGHFQSVDDLIVQGLRAWHERSRQGGAAQASVHASSLQAAVEERRQAVGRIRELRKGVRLERSGLTLREVAHLGHRY